MSFDFTTIIVAALTAGGTLGVGRAARRSPRQEKRDDFDKVTDRLDKEINRVEVRLAQQEVRITQQDTSIAGQTVAISYLHTWIRSLVTFTRIAGLEPPPQPQPVPDEARPYLHDLGV